MYNHYPRLLNEIDNLLITHADFSGVGTIVGLPLLQLAVGIGLKRYRKAYKAALYGPFETNGTVSLPMYLFRYPSFLSYYYSRDEEEAGLHLHTYGEDGSYWIAVDLKTLLSDVHTGSLQKLIDNEDKENAH